MGLQLQSMKKKFKKHYPFHIYFDDKIYFVTSGTLRKTNFFDTDSRKKILKERMISAAERYKVRIFAWTILPNHYHILFQFKNKQNLPGFIGYINGGSSFRLNSVENKRGRQIWWNYWDNCIRDKISFYNRFNYIHYNSVKHNYARSHEDYNFSSYNHYLNRLGQEYMDSILKEYPIVEFTDRNDKF